MKLKTRKSKQTVNHWHWSWSPSQPPSQLFFNDISLLKLGLRCSTWNIWFLLQQAGAFTFDMWDIVPWVGIKPKPPQWDHGVLAIGLPGKSPPLYLTLVRHSSEGSEFLKDWFALTFFFSFMVYERILNSPLCCTVELFCLFILYRSLPLLTPNPQSISPPSFFLSFLLYASPKLCHLLLTWRKVRKMISDQELQRVVCFKKEKNIKY